MRTIQISPFNRWAEFFDGCLAPNSVVYVSLPVKTPPNGILIRGSIVSVKRKGGIPISVAIRLHAKCRLYGEAALPADAVVEMCPSLIVGVDYCGMLVIPP